MNRCPADESDRTELQSSTQSAIQSRHGDICIICIYIIVVHSLERSRIYSDRWSTDDLADGLQMRYQMRVYQTLVTTGRFVWTVRKYSLCFCRLKVYSHGEHLQKRNLSLMFVVFSLILFFASTFVQRVFTLYDCESETFLCQTGLDQSVERLSCHML